MDSEIDPARIRCALKAIFPSRNLYFLLSRGATLVACVGGIAMMGLGSVALVAWLAELDFQATWIPFILVASFAVAWVVGRYCPSQTTLGDILKSEESDGLGCVGVVFGFLAAGSVRSIRELSRPAVFEPRHLDIGVALISACLDRTDCHREDLVATVVQAGSGYQQPEVEFVLTRLQRKKILTGRRRLAVSDELVHALVVEG